jgi:hypothetical protein
MWERREFGTTDCAMHGIETKRLCILLKNHSTIKSLHDTLR